MSVLILPIFFLLFFGVTFLILDQRHGYWKRLNENLSRGPSGQVWNKTGNTVRLACGLYAAALFLVVTVVNICTWVPVEVGRYADSLMWLHLLIMIAFFACGAVALQNRRPGDRRIFIRGLPKWANVVLSALFIYMLALFVLQMTQHHGGYSTTERDGKHFIISDGHAEREMSVHEYWQMESEDLRLFSGFWMGFSFCAAAYLLLAKDEIVRDESRAPI